MTWPWENPPSPPAQAPAKTKAESAPAKKEELLESPPEIKPYSIPTMRGKSKNFHYVPPIRTVPAINADAVFNMVINCFPERPKWGIEIKAVAGLRETGSGISTFDTGGLAKYYAGIIAEMPIYSADELMRQRTQELQRRNQVAADVAKLIKAIVDKQRGLRLLGIAESVEARSQYRVHEGIAPAEEQISALKQVAEQMANIEEANANITAARLALVGQCRDAVADSVNEYLLGIIK